LVAVDQSDPDCVYLNIPSEPNLDELQLTDEQLEAVAGGGTPFFVITVGAATVTIGRGIGDIIDDWGGGGE
jgi:hypothetical protein